MDTQKQAAHDLFARIRNHRLSATFALLATLSVGILAGSVLTRTVSGKEQAVDSSDARPLASPSPSISPTTSPRSPRKSAPRWSTSTP